MPTSGVFQLLGAGMIIGALAAPGWRVTWDGGRAGLRLSGSAGPTQAGVNLRVDAF